MRSLLLLEQRVERFARLAPDGVPVYAASDKLMRSITRFAVHRGVFASFDRKPLPSVADVLADAQRVVLLEDVNNHANVGAIVRSASALGIDALLLDPNSCDPLYRRSLRISMGEALSLPHARTARCRRARAPARGRLRPGSPHAGRARRRHRDRRRRRARPPRALLGAEGAGLSAAVLAEADVRVRIRSRPASTRSTSRAAAAIAFYALRAHPALTRCSL